MNSPVLGVKEVGISKKEQERITLSLVASTTPPTCEMWVCGRHIDSTWELQGIFSYRHLAEKCCYGPEYFIAPFTPNKEYLEFCEFLVEYPIKLGVEK
jgi:hypothetical protein